MTAVTDVLQAICHLNRLVHDLKSSRSTQTRRPEA
jgi:hypothetical protein